MKIALRSNHPANTHGFFKIILSEITPESKLMIPEKFVRDREDKLHGRIMLKAPGGAPWPVDVERVKGRVWLQNGWPEFATFYSLCFGSLLVFQYVEHSDFQVRVFDASATEICYPSTYNLIHNQEASLPKVRKRVAEIVTSSRCKLMRACKKTRASFEESFYIESKLKQGKANGDGGSASKEERERAVDLAKTFESQNPFFIIRLSPSHVSKSGVDIKKSFQVIYRKWKKEDRVIFQVESRSWPVDCSMINGDRCILNSGWKTFISDNLLNAGDVCVFELINPSRKLFKVFIFRAKREAAAA